MSDISFAESLDRLKESFLWAAAQGGNREDCESLISFGADVNWKNPEGDTPLLAACRRGHADTVALLLAHGADSNVCGKDSLTPLHVCTKRGDSSTLNALLEGNTNTTITTSDGHTALDIAKAKGYTDIYSVLMGYRGRLSRPDNLLPAPSALAQNTPAAPRRAGELQPVASSTSTSTGNTRSLGSSSARSNPNISVGAALGRRSSSDSLHRANSSQGSAAPPHSSAVYTSEEEEEAGLSLNMALALGLNTLTPVPAAAATPTGGSVRLTSASSSNRIPLMPASTLSAKESTAASSSTSNNSHSVVSSSQSVKRAAANGIQAANSALTTSTLPTTSTAAAAPPTAAAPSYPNPNSGVNYLIASLQKKEGGDPTVTSLKNMLDAEVARRTDIEDKLNKFKEQHTQLLKEMTSLNAQFNALQEDAAESEAYLSRLLGKKGALDELTTIEECEELERLLKTSLECVEERKALIIRDKIGSQKEQRLCVICQENEKSVVLIPCRHMCLCEGCSNHKQLKQCPLCRKTIESKISVFS